MFSFLAAVEEIAVLAARRGDCIKDQLEDELSHRDSFAAIAERLGGTLPVGESTRGLVRFLEDLRGEASLALLNVVSESWLEGVFHHLSPIAPDLFAIVEAEEARHAHEALSLARPDPAVSLPLIREVERHLYEVATAPEFIVPVSYLIGEEATARMGLANVRDHRRACAHLGVEPGSKVKDMEISSRAAIFSAGNQPTPLPMNTWERNKFKLWDRPEPMQTYITLETSETSPAAIEARVIRAASRVLALHPQLNRTTRGQQIYACSDVRIGVRRAHDEAGDLISTLYLTNPHHLTIEQVRGNIRHQLRRLRRRPYEELPDFRGLEEMLPPPRCALTITQVAPFGIGLGFAPLTPVEGAPISLCIGEERHGQVQVGVNYDHRVGDGREIGLLATQLQEEFARR